MLRADEVERLRAAFEDPNNLLPIEQVKFGEKFVQAARNLKLSEASLRGVRSDCGNFLLTLCRQLIEDS